MSRLSRILPLVAVVGSGAWLGSSARMPRAEIGEMKIHAFGRLPVVYEGRVKPFDTLARTTLLLISNRQTYRDGVKPREIAWLPAWLDPRSPDGEKRAAAQWLLEVLSGTPAADEYKVFRIDNYRVLEFLGLEPRKGYRYAWSEIGRRYEGVRAQAAKAFNRDVSSRDAYDNEILTLHGNMQRFLELRVSHLHPDIKTKEDLAAAFHEYGKVANPSMPLAVPPADRRAEWTPLTEVALFNSALDLGIDKELKLASIEPNQDARLLVTLLESYRDGDVAGFNNAMAAYENRLSRNPPEGTRKLGSEAFFNHAEPFYHATVLYVSAFVLCACSWLGWTRTLSRTAFWLIALTFVLHTTALIARIYISGYPPVTTLYSSAIFIGWGCVLLGLILESIRPIGVGNLIGSVTGFLSLIIAHYLSLDDGDTFKMMQAVLDTRFWLATHVTTITLGYTATYVAGAIAVYYVLRGVFTRTFDAETQREVGRMIYGTLCFALLLSFVGTVLGGLWADDSWGRFWGWDPKENGALIIVLWNALVLHARWGGMVKARGIAVLAIFGNIVTSWSWFGVNQLGIGLHSYGFMESAAFWLIVFVCSQLLIMAVGLIPKHRWRSHNLLDVNGTNGSHDQPLWSRT